MISIFVPLRYNLSLNTRAIKIKMNYLDKANFVATNKGVITDKYKMLKEVAIRVKVDWTRHLRDCISGVRENSSQKYESCEES